MITVNYGLSLRLKGKRKKKQFKNCQGLELDFKETQHKKIRDAIRAKHPGWILEGYVIIEPIVESITVPVFKKKKKIILNKEELIEQINHRLHSVATAEETFAVSNILLGTRFSEKNHVLVSRL